MVLGGCSTVRFAYENADVYVRWKAEAYLDVQGDDADELDDRIEEFHAWHRKHALPQYARLARDASQRFSAGLSRRDLVWGYDAVRAQARESLRKAAELAAPLLDRLTPEQMAHIERRFAEDNRQFYRNNLRGTEGERRKKRVKFMVERLEDWVGKLSQAQVERVREYAERAPLLDELRDRDRKRLQRQVMEIIRARAARKSLPGFAAAWDLTRDPAFVAGLEQWREQYFALISDIERSLTTQQRARALGHMRRYADEFEALAAR